MPAFSPKDVTKDLLSSLPERSRKVLSFRFGLGLGGEQRTLDAIGKQYGITRERVRQIENHGIASIRNSERYGAHGGSLLTLREHIAGLGGIMAERDVLTTLPRLETEKNHVIFLLHVGPHFTYKREDNDFHARWHVDGDLASAVERALVRLHRSLNLEHLIPEGEFIANFEKHLAEEGVVSRPRDHHERWLLLSKRIAKNPLGEWGRIESPHVRIKNTRDFAYLTLKRHGSPMHFREVSDAIRKIFSRNAHPATTHNELIKDRRFVLVGRGLYALKEWGYSPGVVRDVIFEILKRDGPLKRTEIIERVKRERYVKNATILVNLQSGDFVRTPEGLYAVA